jgi:hypothetical protein
MRQYDDIAWQEVDPEKTITFWKNYLNKQPLLPIQIHQRKTEFKPFEAEDPRLLLGNLMVRESLLPVSLSSAEMMNNPDEDLDPKLVDPIERVHFPYCAVGKLLFTLATKEEIQPFEGSAFVIHTKNHQAVFTAGHCLFSERSLIFPRQWAQNVVFIPFYEGDKRSLRDYFQLNDVYLASGLGVAAKWADSEFDTRYEFDLGCFLLGGGKPNLREKTGALGWIAGAFPPQEYPYGQSVGYPIGDNFDSKNLWKTNVKISCQKFVTGFPHIRMKGNCFSQGASGGPVIVSSPVDPSRFYALGLNAALSSYSPDFVYWDSPRFGRVFLSMIRLLEEKALST